MRPIYSARVTRSYRAVGILEDGELVWFWVGTHADYDSLLARLQYEISKMKSLPDYSIIVLFLIGLGIPMGARAQEPPMPEKPSYVRLKAPVIALDNVRVIDGTGRAPIEAQTVLIVSGKIESVSATHETVVPENAVRLDLRGRSVLPGLVMLHEHMMYFSGRAIWHPQPVSYPPLYLAAGVTTVRTAGTDYPMIDLNLKERIDNGDVPGPRMHVTGPFFNGEGDGFLGEVIVQDEEEGRKEVRYWAHRGITSFKVYSSISRAALKGVIEEAHGLGLTVAGHLGTVGCREAANLGIDSIEHSFAECLGELGVREFDEGFAIDPESPEVRKLIHDLVDSGVSLIATPSAVNLRISDKELAQMHPETRRQYLDNVSGDLPSWWPNPAYERELRKLELAFLEAGGRLLLGTDASDFGLIAGFSNHRVLELMVEAGFAPLVVIRMATLEGARFLGVADHLGSISEGLVADLVVVNGNPAERIQDIQKVELVFKAGVAYNPDLLRESVKGLVGWH